jgi:hypothetical protein
MSGGVVLYLINDYMGQNTPLLEFSLAQRYESGSSRHAILTAKHWLIYLFPPHHVKQNRGL